MGNYTKWDSEASLQDLKLDDVRPARKAKEGVSNRFEERQYALTTELNRPNSARSPKGKKKKSPRFDSDLGQFIEYYATQKVLSKSMSESFRAITHQCPEISGELLDETSLQSFRDSTTYAEKELADLRAKQEVLQAAIAELEQKPAADKVAENEEASLFDKGISLVEQVVSLVSETVLGEEKVLAKERSLTENMRQLKKDVALSNSIPKTESKKLIDSIPKLGFFERIQNGLCKMFLRRPSQVAQSRAELVQRVQTMHNSADKLPQKATQLLEGLKSVLKKASDNIEKRAQTIQTLQDHFNREKEAVLDDLSVVKTQAAVLAALPEKKTKSNENLKVSNTNLAAIEKEILSIQLLEGRKQAIHVPVDAAQAEIDKMMAKMFGSEEELTSNLQAMQSEELDAEQQEIDRILSDIDSDLTGAPEVLTAIKKSNSLVGLTEKSNELKKGIAVSYRAAEVSHNSIQSLKKTAEENKEKAEKLVADIGSLQPGRGSLAVLHSKNKEILDLKAAAQRQTDKQERNLAEVDRRESELEVQRAATSDLLLECKKARLNALSALCSVKIAHCDQVISANEARLKQLPGELVLEPVQGGDTELDSFQDIYKMHLKKSGLPEEVKQSLKKSEAAHEKAQGLKKSYEKEMQEYRETIADPNRSFFESAKEMLAGFIQDKSEAEIQNSTEMDRIDYAIRAQEEHLANLEKFHGSILAYNGNLDKLESKKEAFQAAYLEEKKEVGVLSTLVTQASKEEIRERNIEKDMQGVVSIATAAITKGIEESILKEDEKSVLEDVASAVISVANAMITPEVTPMMSEVKFAEIVNLEANEHLKSLEDLVSECVELSDEIAANSREGYSHFKKGGEGKKVHQLKEKTTELMQKIYASSRQGELEFDMVKTIVMACKALQHAVHTALLNSLLAIPSADDSPQIRVEKIKEAEMWIAQAQEWLDAQMEELSAEGQETVYLHRFGRVENWLNLQRHNYELLMDPSIQSKIEHHGSFEKAIYGESAELLAVMDEVTKQGESAQEALREYKAQIEEAKKPVKIMPVASTLAESDEGSRPMEQVATEELMGKAMSDSIAQNGDLNPVNAPVEKKDSIIVGNPNAFLKSAPQPGNESKQNLVYRGLTKAFAAVSAVIINVTTWFGTLIESGGAGFI